MSASRKASYWAGMIKEWENSNQTQVIFCKERDISHHAFSYWRTRFNNIKKTRSETGFLKVLPTASKEKEVSINEGLTIWVKDSVKMIINAPSHITLAASLIKSL